MQLHAHPSCTCTLPRTRSHACLQCCPNPKNTNASTTYARPLQFVQLQGFRKYGLVHSSQVSAYINFSKEDSDEEKKAELVGGVGAGVRTHSRVKLLAGEEGAKCAPPSSWARRQLS